MPSMRANNPHKIFASKLAICETFGLMLCVFFY